MITSPKRGVEYDLPDDTAFCDWCDSPLSRELMDDQEHESGYDALGPGKSWRRWCSDICRQIVVEGKWPSPVGPATHDEMVGWIEELEREKRERQERIEARPDAFDVHVASIQQLIDEERSRIQAHEQPVKRMDEVTAEQARLAGQPEPEPGRYSGEVR